MGGAAAAGRTWSVEVKRSPISDNLTTRLVICLHKQITSLVVRLSDMGDLFTSTDQVLPAAAAPPMPALQRRYSVTGQTPPDHAAAAKSPKLQGLDTSVPTGNCNLCESCGRNNGRSEERR